MTTHEIATLQKRVEARLNRLEIAYSPSDLRDATDHTPEEHAEHLQWMLTATVEELEDWTTPNAE